VIAELPAKGRNGLLYVDLAQLIPLVQALSAADDEASGTLDADEACAAFPTQEAAQTAYDEDIFANGDLDQDFDGEACEDFFAAATPVAAASPAAGIAAADFSGIRALALVAFEDQNLRRSSTILYIEE